MNLSYVRDFLKERRKNNSLTITDVDTLISEIEAYQGTEDTITSISRVMRVLSEYNTTFLTEVQQYELIPKNEKYLLKRMEKVRDILCTLSALHTYLMLTLSTIKDNTYETKNIRGYLLDLNEKKELFRSEKMTWITVLKSLTQEVSYVLEMKRINNSEEVN